MPLYEYECPGCQNTFEVIAKISDGTNINHCPNCGAQGYRLLSSFSWKHQTSSLEQFKHGADEKMFYAERRLSEDKSLDPGAWIEKVKAEKISKKASR
ncbi:FmdB family zinc ribbon protein [Dehalogenimonas etheniformans]|uniref:Zinc ribbon domain-containing protein n=1 Tax=Dehalogenimonas etheniformans TaxID=1536648 RepID=A0A2P5PA22_9CHLR|nr:zinc ribbon domain-containing protein [Dehalogenimonas etheniformans]PPD59142.1 zinc ribbon domain-containing protein [Dehalogenimonas etheniformans]QNT75814.1 zinc ribbon domain-containing protein [Dehalogenimonas etheniformans]